MLIKKTQLDFAFEETMNILALYDECDLDERRESFEEALVNNFEEALAANLAKFKLDDDFNDQLEENDIPVIDVRYCEDSTTGTYDIFDLRPSYIEATLTFDLGCTICGLIPGIGSSLNEMERHYYQAVNLYYCGLDLEGCSEP